MIQGWDQTRALLFPSKAFCSLGLSPLLCIMGQYQLLRLLMYSSECHCTVPLLLSPYLGVTLVFGAPGLAPAFLGAPPTQRRSRLACGVSRGLKVPACLPESVVTSSLISAQARGQRGLRQDGPAPRTGLGCVPFPPSSFRENVLPGCGGHRLDFCEPARIRAPPPQPLSPHIPLQTPPHAAHLPTTPHSQGLQVRSTGGACTPDRLPWRPITPPLSCHHSTKK